MKRKDAMDEEINAITNNDTQELASFSKNHKVIGFKWVYKTREIYKAMLVAKGQRLKVDVDYDNVFAPLLDEKLLGLLFLWQP